MYKSGRARPSVGPPNAILNGPPEGQALPLRVIFERQVVRGAAVVDQLAVAVGVVAVFSNGRVMTVGTGMAVGAIGHVSLGVSSENSRRHGLGERVRLGLSRRLGGRATVAGHAHELG